MIAVQLMMVFLPVPECYVSPTKKQHNIFPDWNSQKLNPPENRPKPEYAIFHASIANRLLVPGRVNQKKLKDQR